jgi:exosortase
MGALVKRLLYCSQSIVQRKIDLRIGSLCLLAVSAAGLYADVAVRLVSDWYNDDNYSHGFVIVPLALFFAYERREQLLSAPRRPMTALGLLVVAGSLLLLVAGTLGSEFFLTRVSLVGALAGTVMFLLGAAHLRILAFPLAFLLLMIPIPAIVFNQIAFPLQLVASRFGESVVALAGVPVLREGNVIVLASTTLEVAEACSGIRSLISLLTLGILVGYFTDRRLGIRTLLALVTMPIAIISNGLRVAGTGIAAHHFGSAAAEGFFHTFSGWLVFLTATAMLLAVGRITRALWPALTGRPQPVQQFS